MMFLLRRGREREVYFEPTGVWRERVIFVNVVRGLAVMRVSLGWMLVVLGARAVMAGVV
jgi:hypothetical protein